MDTKNEFKKILGSNVRSIRLEKKLSVEKLALLADLEYSQVSRIELGKISTSAYTVYVLSQALEVCPSVFYNNTKKDIQRPETVQTGRNRKAK